MKSARSDLPHAVVPLPPPTAPHRLLLPLLLVGWALSAASNTSAQSTNWTNATLGNWVIDSNWSSGVPQFWQSVFIPEGTALISSPTSAVSSTLSLGTGGILNGSIIINNGGSYTNAGGSSIGTYAGANSAITVSGANSSWQTDFLTIGGDNFSSNGGNGTLLIDSGGFVHMNYGRLGFINGSNGSATVTGANSIWEMLNLAVGGRGNAANNVNGTGTLQVSSSGLVSTGNLQVYDTGSAVIDNGSSIVSGLTVSGGPTNDSWGWDGVISSPLGPLTVANTSSGRMVIQTGGTVSDSIGTIGANSGTVGSVLVQGTNSTWNNSSDVVVGQSGNGTLEVRGGGTLFSLRGHVGFNSGSSGSVIVSDPGSTWTASGSMFLGNGGTGSLQVLNGGVASTAGNSYLGFATTALGTATVGGAGSTWSTAGGLYIGGNAAAPGGAFGSTLRIQDGGAVHAAAITLYNTGTLELSNATTLSGPLTCLGGLIRTSGDTSLTDDVTLGSGGLYVVNSTTNSTSTFSGTISGAGGLTTSGPAASAVLRLTGNCNYTGPTIVNSGTLLLAQGAAGSTLAGNVTVNGGALNVGGTTPLTVGGTLTVNAGAKVSLNAGPARMTHYTKALSITGTGLMDLGNHGLLVDNAATPETSIRQYLHNGYNADSSGIGNWLGTGGITSSDAIASHNGANPDFRISVGYVDGNYATDPLVGGAIPGQETLPTNRTLIRPALYGDYNLDGKVDDTDLAIFSGLGQYNQPNAKFGWLGGDLNHDGKVDDTDLLIFSGAGNYNGPSYGAAAAEASHASATPSLTGHADANGEIILSASTSQGAAGDGVLDFVYDPATGDLTLSYDGDPRVTAAQPFQVVRFKSAGGHFIPGNFNQTDFGAGVTATTAMLNGTASGSKSAPDGYDMGAVLPTGLTVSDLTSDLTLQWNVFGGGLTLKNGDVLVPEPGVIGLAAGCGVLLCRRSRRARGRGRGWA